MTTDTQPKTDLASEAYAEIRIARRDILRKVDPRGPRDLRSLLLRGERKPISRLSRMERNKIAKDGMFTYMGDSPLRGHEWWSTPSGEPVVLSTKRIEAILDGTDDGGVPTSMLKEFEMPTGADEGQEDEHGIRPTEAETEARSEAIQATQNDLDAHSATRSGEAQDRLDQQAMADAYDAKHFWPDGTKRVRIEADTPDAAPEDQDTRQVYSAEMGVKDLADGLERVTGFLEALKDPEMGHKAVAEAFPFTSETSVRRWRKNNGVVLS